MVENIINIVKNNIISNNLINKNDKVIVAVSGGPDSMCLVDSLYKLKEELEFEIIVAHVNHGIREESEQEKVYVETYCKERNIPFNYLKVDIPALSKEQKISEETCGRNVRYEFFEELRKKENANTIAVAHNLNDNVETVLLNIIRGCGLKGLTGMDFKFNNIIRPLLTIEKRDILLYNKELELNPCFDKTNEEEIYLRNKVRLSLIPSLQELNPNFITNINRMRNILKEDNDFIEYYVEEIFKKVIIEEDDSKIIFNFSLFMDEHDSIKNRIVRKIIEKKISNLDGIESIHVLDIIKLLKNNIRGKKYIIGNKFTIEILKKNIAVIY
ncbi:MAG: tRNA lysidine(34) synthetase TilS [Clostridia bacterium]|nr:tRNA lysidine(34) synthetase TilS [Clostridia bacterium]